MGGFCVIKKCDWCGNDVEIRHKQRLSYQHIFCSCKCESEFRKNQTPKETICPICGKAFHVKKYRQNKDKTHCCSKKCKRELDKIKMSGEGNHQYGLKGELNASWKSDERISVYGYKLIRNLYHPFKNGDGFVFEHRLVVEKYMLIPENSIEIDGTLYLSPEWAVHHIDFNRLNNAIDNLFPLPKGLHTKFHSTHRNLKDCSVEEKRKAFFDFAQGEAMCQGIIQQFFQTDDDNTDDVRNGGLGSSDKK